MDIRDQVRTFISGTFYVADPALLPDDASLLERGVVDSTGVLEVIAFIERTFGVTVTNTEMRPDNLDSIAKISAFVARKRI